MTKSKGEPQVIPHSSRLQTQRLKVRIDQESHVTHGYSLPLNLTIRGCACTCSWVRAACKSKPQPIIATIGTCLLTGGAIKQPQSRVECDHVGGCVCGSTKALSVSHTNTNVTALSQAIVLAKRVGELVRYVSNVATRGFVTL